MSKRDIIREIKRDLDGKADYISFKYITVKEIYDLLKKQPEIILCKDCKLNIGTPHNPMCKKDCNSHESNWYCADGDRIEGEVDG